MSEPSAVAGTPLVLLINDEEWTTRSIESILKPEGYAVLRAYSGREGLELASRIRPDILLIDFRLPDITGIDLCSRMRKVPTIRASTPILIFTSGSLRRQDELEGFRAGAWGMLSPPFNPEELLARLGPLVAAKRDADAALEASFVDPLTGFYNIQGLMRRVSEVSADTIRSHRPLSCVVLGPGSSGEAEEALSSGMGLELAQGHQEAAQSMGAILVSSLRSSDAIGRIGYSDFVIVAPGTNSAGALRIAERLLERVDASTATDENLRDLDIRAGLCSISGEDPRAVMVPEEFLRRATVALRQAQTESGGTNRIRSFQDN